MVAGGDAGESCADDQYVEMFGFCHELSKS
jgi:hypothetical protein